MMYQGTGTTADISQAQINWSCAVPSLFFLLRGVNNTPGCLVFSFVLLFGLLELFSLSSSVVNNCLLRVSRILPLLS